MNPLYTEFKRKLCYNKPIETKGAMHEAKRIFSNIFTLSEI